MVITNGMVVPNYSSRAMYERMYATGVTQYGQMTAGSYCYIGPQGIVHGTTITILNAARKYLGLGKLDAKAAAMAALPAAPEAKSPLGGVVYLSSGLGGAYPVTDVTDVTDVTERCMVRQPSTPRDNNGACGASRPSHSVPSTP